MKLTKGVSRQVAGKLRMQSAASGEAMSICEAALRMAELRAAGLVETSPLLIKAIALRFEKRFSNLGKKLLMQIVTLER
mgnify:CR=1 FL=1